MNTLDKSRSSSSLLALFKDIHDIFPVPATGEFKGTHAILLNADGALELMIWKDVYGKVMNFPVVFDEAEVITRELLLKVAVQMDAQIEEMYDDRFAQRSA